MWWLGQGAARLGGLDSLPVFPGTLRALARSARHLPDRLLHRWRRKLTAWALARRPAPRTVLVVCHGNICRSPYAAAVARRLFPPDVVVESAGFIGPDRPSPPEALAVAAERGLDLTPHRSRSLTPDALRAADVVVVMDADQRRRIVREHDARAALVVLGDLDPEPISRRAIPDPENQPTDAFRSCYDRIDRCVRELARLWNEPTERNAGDQRGHLQQGSARQPH